MMMDDSLDLLDIQGCTGMVYMTEQPWQDFSGQKGQKTAANFNRSWGVTD